MGRCNPKLQRKRQVLAKEEVTCGVYEAPSAEDGKIRVYKAPQVAQEAPLFKRDIARATLSNLPGVSGAKSGTATYQAELVGSGSVAIAPEIDVHLRACGMVVFVTTDLAISGVTGGPFLHAEVVTGGTSSATGRVVAVSDTSLSVEVLTGTFSAAETITGADSGADATADTITDDAGFGYRPTSDLTSYPTLTIEVEEDGYVKTLVGCRGTFNIKAESGQPALIEFTMSGAVYEDGWGDRALTTGITYNTTIPPVFMGVGFVFNEALADEFSPILRTAELDAANSVSVRADANSDSGYIAALITERVPMLKVDPEMMNESEWDIFGKLFSSAAVTASWHMGAIAGNRVEISAMNGQLNTVSDGENEGLTVNDVEVMLNGVTDAGDDEYEIVFR